MYVQIRRWQNAIHYCKDNDLMNKFDLTIVYQYLDSNPIHVQCLDF